MSIKPKHFAVAGLVPLLLLGGCWKAEDLDVDASQCWNPKIIRAKVGNAIFDLPPGIDFYIQNGTKNPPPGILMIDSKSRSSHPEYRLYCQDKKHVPYDFSNHARYKFNINHDVNNPLLGEIRVYNPNSNDKRFSYYISDAKNVGNIKFLRYNSRFRGKREFGRVLVFGFKGREADMPCLVWGKQNPSEDAWVEGTTYAYGCSGGIPLLMGDIIITVATPNTMLDPDTKKPRMPPPERWPEHWNDTIQKITSYRIDQARTDKASTPSG